MPVLEQPSDSRPMASWDEFSRARPDLAAAGRALIYQFGVGLAFMATSRADGGPRLHPMCPLLTADALFAFIVPSPKRGDLLRDGRYALHSFPADANEDAFYVTGRATPVTDEATRAALVTKFAKEREMDEVPADIADWMLF